MVAVKAVNSAASVGGWCPRTPDTVSSHLPSSTGTYAAPRGHSGQPGTLTPASGAVAGSLGRYIRVA